MLLPLLIIVPFFGAVLCWQSERVSFKLPRWIALMTIGTTLSFSLLIWFKEFFLMNKKPLYLKFWQSEFLVSWIPRFGIDFHLGIDGLSILMIILTGFLGIMSILCSWSEIKKNQGLFYFFLIWLLGSVLGVFLAIDLFLFFFFWEMMLVPMYFLVSLWGYKAEYNQDCVKAANKFFIYTQSSGLIMLIGIISLVISHYYITNIWTFNYNLLLNTPMDMELEFFLMLCFFLAFAVKMPIVPFHTWLPDFHAYAPTAGSVDLSGILLKTAAYGLLRFTIYLFPHSSSIFSIFVMYLGVVTIFYSAWMAFSQKDIKRLVAYGSISNMGFILMAIYANNKIAFEGVIVQMLAHGISTAALFILIGQLYERVNTRDINEMGGLWSKIKWIPAFSLFFSIANIGIPGTGNFVGEFMILLGIFTFSPFFSGISIFILIFSTIYSLKMIQGTYYGRGKNKIKSKNITSREFFIVICLVLVSVLLGFFPQIILDTAYLSLYKF
ncbi:NADH-quinone oxidoreductase subunit M [Buchnera aphidicola]|uniref:NADH-quinone oxidoreductase subunit M n=1 Tax=Buchnera aphidicola TaxID=9 RepID=UPI0034644519